MRDGRTPPFCSACGSRTLSRKRLSGVSASLRHQVDLLTEIARRQDEDLGKMAYERDRLRMEVDRRSALGLPGTEQAVEETPAQTKEHFEGLIASERAEVNRLQRELQVWRERGPGLGDGPPLSGEQIAGRASIGDQDLRQEEVRHEAERQQWLTRRGLLENMIEDVKGRIQSLERSSVAERPGTGAAGALNLEFGAARAEIQRLRQELEENRQAVATAWGQATRIRQEAEEERASKAGLLAQRERELSNVAEELHLAERRAEVEVELRRAQEAQLQSVRGTIEALRSQLHRARAENSDLRKSLEQNQDVLRRLRG